MSDTYTTRTGRVLTDADFDALADEAERGYDVSHFVGAGGRITIPFTVLIAPTAKRGALRAHVIVDDRVFTYQRATRYPHWTHVETGVGAGAVEDKLLEMARRRWHRRGTRATVRI